MAVVVTGEAIEILAQGSPHDSCVFGLVEDVSFEACENWLERADLAASVLFDGVETVRSGVGERPACRTRATATPDRSTTGCPSHAQ